MKSRLKRIIFLFIPIAIALACTNEMPKLKPTIPKHNKSNNAYSKLSSSLGKDLTKVFADLNMLNQHLAHNGIDLTQVNISRLFQNYANHEMLNAFENYTLSIPQSNPLQLINITGYSDAKACSIPFKINADNQIHIYKTTDHDGMICTCSSYCSEGCVPKLYVCQSDSNYCYRCTPCIGASAQDCIKIESAGKVITKHNVEVSLSIFN